MRRLFGAILDGFGNAIGRELFDDAKEALNDASATAPFPAASFPSNADLARAAKESASQTRQAAKDRESAKKRAEAEIDQELRALKKRMAREGNK